LNLTSTAHRRWFPIKIELEEGRTKEFNSKLGYDTYEGFRGGVEYIDHNFLEILESLRGGGR